MIQFKRIVQKLQFFNYERVVVNDRIRHQRVKTPLFKLLYDRNRIVFEMVKKSKIFCSITFMNLVSRLMTPLHQRR